MRETLRNRRLELGLKQKDVAAAVEISEAYYSLIESRGKTPDASIMGRIAAKLHTRPDELFVELRGGAQA